MIEMTFERWMLVVSLAMNFVWFLYAQWNTRYIRHKWNAAESKLDAVLRLHLEETQIAERVKTLKAERPLHELAKKNLEVWDELQGVPREAWERLDKLREAAEAKRIEAYERHRDRDSVLAGVNCPTCAGSGESPTAGHSAFCLTCNGDGCVSEEKYKAMMTPAKTPEPLPSETPEGAAWLKERIEDRYGKTK